MYLNTEIRFSLKTLSIVLVLISCVSICNSQTLNRYGICGTDSRPTIRIGHIELVEIKQLVNDPESPLKEKKTTFALINKDSLSVFLIRNLRYPDWAMDCNIQGKVTLEFSISEEGSISNTTVIREAYGGGKVFTPEAIRLVESLPKFQPAESNKKLIPSKMEMTLNFILK